MVHPTIRNKPDVFQPEFSRDWTEVVGPLEELKHHVSNGGAFIGSRMTSGHRSSSAFDFADLAVVDIDHGLTIQNFLQHLPSLNLTLFKSVVTLLSRSLGGDKACTDSCRLFYGNDAADHLSGIQTFVYLYQSLMTLKTRPEASAGGSPSALTASMSTRSSRRSSF